MSFSSASSHGFVRVAACMEPVVLADPHANAEAVIARLGQLDQEGVALACFPELGLTGYSLDDLFASTRLLTAAEEALVAVAEATRDLAIAAVVGLPLRHRDALYNCAALVAAGTVHLLAVKRDLPNYREFYEPRNFASGRSLPAMRCGDAATTKLS